MRLFAAVLLPPDVRADLEGAVRTLAADRDDAAVRWAPVEQWHVTLAFFGEVADDRVDALAERLGRVAAETPSLGLRVRGAGAFGSPRRARVVWVGVDGDLASLRALATSTAAVGRAEGADVEERRYRPHVTLARLRAPADVSALVGALADYEGPAWRAGELALVRSHLGAGDGGRARHETRARWRLGSGDLDALR